MDSSLSAEPNAPVLLCKYKSVSNEDDLSRALDVINSRRLYAPRLEELNDPMESHFYDFFLGSNGYAGYSMSKMYGKIPAPANEIINSMRIVSFSSVWDSPQMWAYYAENYTGICFCFYRAKFSNIILKMINYQKTSVSIDVNKLNEEGLRIAIENCILTKESNWQHEHEWRAIVSPSDPGNPDSKYVHYTEGGLAAVIIGERRTKMTQSFAETCLSMGIPTYSTHTDRTQLKILFPPFGSQIAHNGTPVSEQVDKLLKEKGMIDIFDLAQTDNQTSHSEPE